MGAVVIELGIRGLRAVPPEMLDDVDLGALNQLFDIAQIDSTAHLA